MFSYYVLTVFHHCCIAAGLDEQALYGVVNDLALYGGGQSITAQVGQFTLRVAPQKG